MKMFEKTRIISVALLLASILIHVYLGYFAVTNRDIYDDIVSWFHIHVVNSIRTSSFKTIDYSLRFSTGRDLLQSPILIDFFIAFLNLPFGLWTMLAGALLLVIIYYVALIITGNKIVAGVSSVFVSTTPCFNYWFKYNIYGAYTLLSFFYVYPILLYYGFTRDKTKFLLAGSIVGSVLWFIWSDGWLTLLIYSLFISTLMFKNILIKKYLYPSVVLLTATLPVNILIGYKYVTVFHVFSYLALLFATLLMCLVIWYREILGSYSQIIINTVGSISVFTISIYLTIVINNFVNYPGVMEDYSALYNPLFDYGLVGLFSLLALIMIIRSRVLQDIRNRFLDFALISSFIIGVVVSYFIHPLTVVTAASITPYIALSIVTISSTIYRSGRGLFKLIYLIISVWLVAGAIVASAIPSYAVSRYSPVINTVDVPREIIRKIVVNESGFINTLNSIKNIDSDKLVICYWKYSYWVTGFLGSNSYTLADMKGEESGWRLFSWIMLSDEKTAYELIKKIINNRTGIEIYVLISEVISIDLTTAGERKAAELGGAIIYPSALPGRTVEVTHQVYGDVARILEYIRIAGFNYSDYLTTRGLRYHHEYPLAWVVKTTDSLLVKLLINGLDSLGYDVSNNVYNRLYGERILNRDVRKPFYFRLVNATVTPLYRVTRDIYDYQISLYVALYKLEL